VNRMGLVMRGLAHVSQPLSQTTPIDLYDVSIELIARNHKAAGWHTLGLAPTVQAGVLPERESGPRRFPMPIVGRDVLARCTFLYNGPQETIELEIPSKKRRRLWSK